MSKRSPDRVSQTQRLTYRSILEAYTFNFAYAKGSDVPTMSLDQLTLADGASQSQSAQRYVLGTPRSEQDVRTSVAVSDTAWPENFN